MSVGSRYSANSQKMDLKWTSVWRAKCKEFHRKMKDYEINETDEIDEM